MDLLPLSKIDCSLKRISVQARHKTWPLAEVMIETKPMIESIEELKQHRDLIDAIDWDMTPENAVRVYLEWGNIHARGNKYVVRSKADHTVYFVVNCWSRPFYIYLLKRNSEEALELARIELPAQFEKPVCELKGVYAVDGDLKDWLRKKLDPA